MDEGFRAKLQKAVSLWNSTEKVVKQAELFGGQIVFPSINELRYAGRWMVLALEAELAGRSKIDQLTTAEEALSYACLCCMQAKHDAIDSIVLYVHEKVSKLSDRYSNRVISMYVNDFDLLLVRISEVDNAILLSRESRQDRADLYDKVVSEHLPIVLEYVEKIRRAETLINEELEEELKREEAENARHQLVVDNLKQVVDNLVVESKQNKLYFHISLAINVLLIVLGFLALIPIVQELAPHTASAAVVKEAPKTPAHHAKPTTPVAHS